MSPNEGATTIKSAVSWQLRFPCAESAAASERVHVQIARGGCPISGELVYDASFYPGDSVVPDELAAGAYAVFATAADESGRTVANACTAITLPRSEPITLLLIGDEGCADVDAGAPFRAPEVDPDVDACLGAQCDGGVDAGVEADAAVGGACAGAGCDRAGDAGPPIVDAGGAVDGSMSVCDASSCLAACQAMSTGGQCACGLSLLPDDRSFRDAQGYSCGAWKGQDCFDTERLGYTQAEGEAIRVGCSTTCGVCW